MPLFLKIATNIKNDGLRCAINTRPSQGVNISPDLRGKLPVHVHADNHAHSTHIPTRTNIRWTPQRE